MDITLNRPSAALAASTRGATVGRAGAVAGRVVSSLAAVMLALDGLAKLLRVPQVLEGTAQLGYSADLVVPIGITLLACVLLYIVPATSLLGALLLTGYLGGAVATHVRVGSPVLTHVLTPVYVAAAVWLGLVLRDPRLRALAAGRRQS